MIEKLKWITWSIMPLVYDESLSYVELLDKVIAKLNEVIEATNNFTKPVQETIDAWLKSDEGQAAVEQSVGDFIVAYSKTPSFQQVLVSALENQSAEVKTAASEAAEAYLKSPEGKTALDTEIRDYMLVYTKTDEFKNLISEYVMELNDILRGEKLDIRQKNSTTIQTPNTVISSTEIANDYSAGSAKSRVEVNSSGVHIYSDEDMSNPAISASGGVVELGKDIDAKTHRIMNLPTPEAAHEAANKFYVDQAIAEIPGGGGGGGGGAGVITVDVSRNSQGIWTASKTYLEIARNLNYGNVVKAVIRDGREPNALTCSHYTSAEVKFTGVVAIAWPEVTITGRNKPSRYYIDTVTITNNDQVKVDETEWNSANFIQSDGSIPFGNEQSMGNNQLRDLAAPTKDTDAATKGYVDSQLGGGGSGGGGGVSLGEIRLTDLDDDQTGVSTGYDYSTDSYEFYLENDEDNSNNMTGYNLGIFNQLKEACDAFRHIDLGNKPVNATITFYIKFPTDEDAKRWAVNVSSYSWAPKPGSAELGMLLLGRSTAWSKLPLFLTKQLTYHEISFMLLKEYSNSTGKWTYVFKAYLSNPDSSLLNSWGVSAVENIHRDWPTGAMYVVDGYPAKIDSSYALNGTIPSILLINDQINEGTKRHRSCIVAHGCNMNEYNTTNEKTSRNIKFIADYPALNNPNVTFHTTFSGAGDILALPLTVKTTASGVPDVIDGTITVGDDGTISALTLNGINKTLLSGIWSWKDKWDCSSELSLTYLTVGEKTFKYTFKLARAYKVNPNDATNTMYGLDFECDKGDYKMVITQTFDTASETVPAATYKTVKYGGGNSGTKTWEEAAAPISVNDISGNTKTVTLNKPYREIAIYSGAFTSNNNIQAPTLVITTNTGTAITTTLGSSTSKKITAIAKNDYGVMIVETGITNTNSALNIETVGADELITSVTFDYGRAQINQTDSTITIMGR